MKRLTALLCVLALVLVFAGCGTEKPDVVVKQFCEAVKALDTEKMAACMVDGETEASDDVPAPPEVVQLLKSNAQKITYTIGETTSDKTLGMVRVEFQYPNLAPAVEESLKAYLTESLQLVLSGADQEELTNRLVEILTEKINAAEPEILSASLVFHCVKTEEGWKMEPLSEETGKEVVNIMSCNFMSIFEEFADLFG